MHPSRIHSETLSNGLTVLLREAHRAPVAELQVWVQVGSADERPNEAGLAHFHEHMLFKGTERRGVGEVAGEIEGVGGRINAYTSFDVTVYHCTLPADKLGVGLDVLADAVRHPAFEPQEIDREIEVVLEEIRRSEDSPDHVLGDALFAKAYADHPYRAPILGTAESVSRIDRDRLRAFFERWYAADHLVVVAVGDFDAARLAGEVRAAFGDATPNGVRRKRRGEPAQRELRSVVLRRPFERARLELAFPAVAFRHPDTPYLDLLAFILGDCESSRLVRRVRERDGVVDRVDASCYTPLDPGLFSVGGDAAPERAPAAIEAIMREVERLRVEPVARDELETARANFLASEHFDRESVTGLARKLGSFQVLAGDHRAEGPYFEAVRGATPQDLLRVARAHLSPDRLTVGAVLPERVENGLDHAAIATAVERGVSRTARACSAPAAVTPPSTLPSYRLPNGATLHVDARPDVPVAAVRAALLGGSLAETEADAGLTRFLTGMWLRGTRGRSPADFARSVERLAAEIDGFSGRNSLGLTLEAPSEKLEPALELFAEVLLEPAIDREELEKERRETLAAIERREDNLGQQAFLLFAETHFQRHPYRLPMSGTAESVARFDGAQVAAHHTRLMRAENLVLAVAGDVDPDAVAQRLSALLADLPGGAFEAPSPPVEKAPGEIRCAELRKDRAQAHMVLGFRGLALDDPDRYALEVISQLLAGQGGRLFLELRDRRSLAYSVSATNVEGVAPGIFAVYMGTAPEKLDEAKRGVLEQLEALIAAAPGDPELERARRYLIGNFAIGQQRNAARAAHMALDALYGLGADADRLYPRHIETVGAADVLRVARRVVDLDAYTLAVVRP